MNILALLVISALVAAASAWSGCPRPEDMLPCTCIRPRGYTKVTCNGSKKEVQQGLAILSRFWMGVDDMVIISNEVEFLPDRVFGRMDLHTLELTTPNLKNIAVDALRTNERNFNHLKIHSSSITSLGDVLPALSYVLRLYTILINNSPGLTQIEAEVFTDAVATQNLNTIDLSNNAITNIGERAFDALPYLWYLRLHGNKITTFELNAIPDRNQLRSLDLQNNELTALPSALIQKMNRYQQILLQNNTITTVPLNDLRIAAEKLVHVHLEGNEIICDKHFKVIALMNVEHRRHLLYGTCDSPKYLKGIAFKELNTTDF